MARIIDRRKAIDLRKKGMTYSDIRKELDISKSTLSDWLRKYPLTIDQMGLLEKTKKKNKALAIEKAIRTKRKKREARLVFTYDKERRRFLSLNRRELEIAGLFLYWGEGNKRMNGPISINNTDPQVLTFALFWLTSSLDISKDRIKIYLHLYRDMNIGKEMQFWSKELGLPLSQFAKPYIKESKRSDVDHKGFGHGTCGLTVSNVRLKEKIMMGIKAIANNYSQKI